MKKKISTRAPRLCVAYQAPHTVAGDGTHAVAADRTHAVAADRTHAVPAEAPHAVAADRTHAVAGDGSHAVATDRHTRACAAAAARRAWRRGPGPPRTAPRVPHAGSEKNYKVSMRPPATLPLSPRVLKRVFLSPLSTHNSPRSASSWRFLKSAVMAMMVFVSQHEKISMRAPRFCLAYQAPHAVAAEVSHVVAADGTHAVASDGTHTVAGD
jgi:hypothetical protein